VILPPGRVQTGDKPARHWIANGNEDNGEGVGRLLGGQGDECTCANNGIDLERNQFGRESGEPL